jgi:hypothetical protein
MKTKKKKLPESIGCKAIVDVTREAILEGQKVRAEKWERFIREADFSGFNITDRKSHTRKAQKVRKEQMRKGYSRNVRAKLQRASCLGFTLIRSFMSSSPVILK